LNAKSAGRIFPGGAASCGCSNGKTAGLAYITKFYFCASCGGASRIESELMKGL